MKLKDKNHSVKVMAASVLLVWGLPLTILGLTPDEKESEKTSNKSIIIIDNKEQIAYTEYTDRVGLSEVNKNKLNESKQLTSKVDQLVIEKKMKERYAMLEAKRIAEEKRIAAEKAKKIAAEKAKKAELAKIAEEKRKLELVQAAEKKRLADLESKRVAKTKAKEEAKKNDTEKVVASRSSNYQSNYQVTFYTARCTGCSGITANGTDVRNTIYHQGYRVVAAPPNIALGTKLRITFANGSTMDAIAADRGGAIKGKILDILVSTQSEAIANGRQNVKVEILK